MTSRLEFLIIFNPNPTMASRTSQRSKIPTSVKESVPSQQSSKAKARTLSLVEDNRRNSRSSVSNTEDKKSVKRAQSNKDFVYQGSQQSQLVRRGSRVTSISEGQENMLTNRRAETITEDAAMKPKQLARRGSRIDSIAEDANKGQLARRGSRVDSIAEDKENMPPVSSRRGSRLGSSAAEEAQSRQGSKEMKILKETNNNNVQPRKVEVGKEKQYSSLIPVLATAGRRSDAPKPEIVTVAEAAAVAIPCREPPAVPIPPGVINIDIEDGLYEYAADLIVYLRERELLYQLPINFLHGGNTLPGMRAMLVDWLIQVQHHLKLCQETLYLTIIMLDTVLSKRDIPSDKLQLVGVTCLLLASKMEEYYQADISKLISLTENSYNCKQVLRMELVIFGLLDHQLYFPEIMSFLKRYLRAALRGNDEPFLETCQYLIDGSIVDEGFSTVVPSKQAAASILGASLLFSLHVNQDEAEGPGEEDMWTPTLRYYTRYTLHEVVPVAKTMFKCIVEAGASGYNGARVKYTSNSMHKRTALSPHLKTDNVKRGSVWLENHAGNQADCMEEASF